MVGDAIEVSGLVASDAIRPPIVAALGVLDESFDALSDDDDADGDEVGDELLFDNCGTTAATAAAVGDFDDDRSELVFALARTAL